MGISWIIDVPVRLLRLDIAKAKILNRQRKPPSLLFENDEKDTNGTPARPGPESKASKDQPKKKASPSKAEAGYKAQVKDLYWHETRSMWKEYPPRHVGVSVQDSPKLQTWALIRRRKKNEDEGILELDSLTVQSPYLRELLDKTFEGYREISTKLKDMTFKKPFHEFYYRWDNFQEVLRKMQQSDNEVAKAHAELLRKVVTKEIQPHLDKMEDYYANKIIDFDYVWALFEPDVEVVVEDDGEDRMFKLSKCWYKGGGFQSKIFVLECKYVDYDGNAFGLAEATLLMPQFSGIKKMSDLKMLPISLRPDPEKLRKRLETRGEAFERLSGFHYRSYDGFLLFPTKGDTRDKRQVQGRVIVDAKSHATYTGAPASTLRPLSDLDEPQSTQAKIEEEPELLEYEEQMLSKHRRFPNKANQPPQPPEDTFKGTVIKFTETNGPESGSSENSSYYSRKQKALELTSNLHALSTPFIKGFCLSSKKWVTLYVDNIRDISWSEDAFKQLILPYDFKELLLAFLESQFANTNKFDDIIQGKGKGIIILLSGSPGTGKTLTAEAVAEEIRQPLYIMSAGELGYSADEVEKNLEKVLEITTNWRAVLLIDECDVFLEERDTSNIERNKLVSVFLRLLEYHKGVLFLTTNRVSAFDKAFKSRIHLTVNYPDLGSDAKQTIWETFIAQANKYSNFECVFSQKDLQTLATKELNGREIKNVVKTAQLLATKKETPLTIEHIKTVLRVSGDRKLQDNSGQAQNMYC